MNKLLKLRQALADLKAQGRKAVEEINKLEAVENRSDEQNAKLATLEQQVTELEAKVTEAASAVEAEERRLDRERAFGPLTTPTTHTPSPAGAFGSDEPDPETTGGFKGMNEFAAAVLQATPGGGRSGQVDPRLAAHQAAASTFHRGEGTDDGYLVPVHFRDQIWELVHQVDDVLQWVDTEPTGARQVDMLADESTPWGTGGIQVRWENEGAAATASTAEKPEPRSVKLHGLLAFVNATEDLLEDAPRLENRLTNKAALAIRWKIGETLIYGDGAAKPLGWFKSAAKITVAKTAGQAANTITAANVLAMYTRLLVQPGDTPFWMANRDIVPQLATMTINDNLVWTPPVAGLKEAPGGFLLGMPIRWSEHADTLGTEGDLQLLSAKGYYCPVKQNGVRMDTSIHLYFDQALKSFRWKFRLGGQP
ncbi:MAG TPA: phage major capsid protein, partial [Azospirillum sp.]|nr:phage major capsid protein [Azospirillum sp.]